MDEDESTLTNPIVELEETTVETPKASTTAPATIIRTAKPRSIVQLNIPKIGIKPLSTINEDIPEYTPPEIEPMIPASQVLPITARPSPPIDETPITINGQPIHGIKPIEAAPTTRSVNTSTVRPRNLLETAKNLPKIISDTTQHLVNTPMSEHVEHMVENLVRPQVRPKVIQSPVLEPVRPSVIESVTPQFKPQATQFIPPPRVEAKVLPHEDSIGSDIAKSVAAMDEQSVQARISKDYSSMSEVQQWYEREEFRKKFNKLRHDFRDFDIPEVTDSLSLERMDVMYQSLLNMVYTYRDASQYKDYLVVGWMVIEYICGKYGFDITGYTKLQMNTMSKYDHLLLELGENNYKNTNGIMSATSTWAPEWRLLFVSLVNVVVFFAIKFMSGKVGGDMANNLVNTTVNRFGLNSAVGLPESPNKNLESNNAELLNVAASMLGGNGNGDLLAGISKIASMFSNNSENQSTGAPRQRYNE